MSLSSLLQYLLLSQNLFWQIWPNLKLMLLIEIEVFIYSAQYIVKLAVFVCQPNYFICLFALQVSTLQKRLDNFN